MSSESSTPGATADRDTPESDYDVDNDNALPADVAVEETGEDNDLSEGVSSVVDAAESTGTTMPARNNADSEATSLSRPADDDCDDREVADDEGGSVQQSPVNEEREAYKHEQAAGEQKGDTQMNGYVDSSSTSVPPSRRPLPGVIGGGYSLFALDESKAYYERLSLTWAPLSMVFLLGVLLGTPLYKYCDRNTFLLFSCLACVPGFLYPILCPCEADLVRPWHDRFWVKGTVWVSIFGFYGNYFWTHYFYSLLGAEYLFDSYRFNDVPVVTYICTFFYFTFYFTFVNIMLRRVRALTWDFPPFGRRTVWAFTIAVLSYGTALFEALSIQHFPLYTYKQRDLFLLIGSVVYGLYFVVGFPMFFMLDEEEDFLMQMQHSPTVATPTSTQQILYDEQDDIDRYSLGNQRVSLQYVIINAFAACAIVTLLLDLWRLFVGSIYELGGPQGSIRVPFIYQENQQTIQDTVAKVASAAQQAICSMPPIPSTEIIYVDKPLTAEACMEFAKGWARQKITDVTSMLNRTVT